jgi:hypothetical protein
MLSQICNGVLVTGKCSRTFATAFLWLENALAHLQRHFGGWKMLSHICNGIFVAGKCSRTFVMPFWFILKE